MARRRREKYSLTAPAGVKIGPWLHEALVPVGVARICVESDELDSFGPHRLLRIDGGSEAAPVSLDGRVQPSRASIVIPIVQEEVSTVLI